MSTFDMSKAKLAVQNTLANIEQALASNLTPREQKLALAIAQAQLLSNYAILEMRDAMLAPKVTLS
jgi:hypothetical protein